MKRCIADRMNMAGYNLIKNKSDQVLLWNCANKCDQGKSAWYDHRIPYHRAYLHECFEEARRRGLKLPKFNPWAKPTV